jgi:benzoyl-CoA reductase subunit B
MTTRASNEVHGRAMREGRELFDAWYGELTHAHEAGEQTAYVFVMGSLVELLRSFDLHVSFPEINSLQTAVKKVSDAYLSEAEDEGFSPDVCGYVKADYALQRRGGEHPRGRIPPPAVAVLTNACNTYLKWAEIWERMYDPPIVTVDVPQSRSTGDAATGAGFAVDRLYVEHQLRELIEVLERVTGRAFDIDRFREILGHANEMGRQYRRVLALNQQAPAVFDAVLEGTMYLGVANALRGTEAGARYFTDLVEELELRRLEGLGALADTEERHRLIFVGVPCYPIFSRFHQMFSEWGGAFVNSSYLWFASGGLDLDFEYDLAQPIESLAEGVLRSVRRATDAMLFQDRLLIEAVDAHGADGVVYHPVKSCRTVSTGLADSRRVVLDQRDVLALYIESDMMDRRVVSEAQLKNRIDAFFEGLESRKLRTAGAAAGGSAAVAALDGATVAGPAVRSDAGNGGRS